MEKSNDIMEIVGKVENVEQNQGKTIVILAGNRVLAFNREIQSLTFGATYAFKIRLNNPIYGGMELLCCEIAEEEQAFEPSLQTTFLQELPIWKERRLEMLREFNEKLETLRNRNEKAQNDDDQKIEKLNTRTS
jgi:hypothetical protein